MPASSETARGIQTLSEFAVPLVNDGSAEKPVVSPRACADGANTPASSATRVMIQRIRSTGRALGRRSPAPRNREAAKAEEADNEDDGQGRPHATARRGSRQRFEDRAHGR